VRLSKDWISERCYERNEYLGDYNKDMSFLRIHCCIYEFINMISLCTNDVCYWKIAKTQNDEWGWDLRKSLVGIHLGPPLGMLEESGRKHRCGASRSSWLLSSPHLSSRIRKKINTGLTDYCLVVVGNYFQDNIFWLEQRTIIHWLVMWFLSSSRFLV
jgi:hypothetical protein